LRFDTQLSRSNHISTSYANVGDEEGPPVRHAWRETK